MLTQRCDSAELELFSDSCSGTRTGIGKSLCEPTASRVENEVRQSWAAVSRAKQCKRTPNMDAAHRVSAAHSVKIMASKVNPTICLAYRVLCAAG